MSWRMLEDVFDLQVPASALPINHHLSAIAIAYFNAADLVIEGSQQGDDSHLFEVGEHLRLGTDHYVQMADKVLAFCG